MKQFCILIVGVARIHKTEHKYTKSIFLQDNNLKTKIKATLKSWAKLIPHSSRIRRFRVFKNYVKRNCPIFILWKKCLYYILDKVSSLSNRAKYHKQKSYRNIEYPYQKKSDTPVLPHVKYC